MSPRSNARTVARKMNEAMGTLLPNEKIDAEILLDIIMNLSAVCEGGTRGILDAIEIHVNGCEAAARDDAERLTHAEDKTAHLALAEAWKRIGERVNAATLNESDWVLTGDAS